MSDIRTVSIWIVMITVKVSRSGTAVFLYSFPDNSFQFHPSCLLFRDFARESKKPHESRIYKDSWGF